MKIRSISHHDRYFINEIGDVFSEKYGRRVQLKQSEHKGYRRVALSQGNKRTIYPVHRLVAEAFIPNPSEKPFVNHKDGNKRNNHWNNLEWCTAKENSRHAADILKTCGAKMANGRWGYRYTKLYPNEELRNRLVELGVPRNSHNLAELGEMLPEKINIKGDLLPYWIGIDKGGKNWTVFYRQGGEWSIPNHLRYHADTEADARAKMLVYLLENKLITP